MRTTFNRREVLSMAREIGDCRIVRMGANGVAASSWSAEPAAIMLTALARQIIEWIPVSVRLPEPYKRVLVWLPFEGESGGRAMHAFYANLQKASPETYQRMDGTVETIVPPEKWRWCILGDPALCLPVTILGPERKQPTHWSEDVERPEEST